MKWIAAFVESLARSCFRSRGLDHNESARGTSPPAQSTAQKSRPCGAKNTDLTARAMSLHNRDRAKAERYLKTHAILSSKA